MHTGCDDTLFLISFLYEKLHVAACNLIYQLITYTHTQAGVCVCVCECVDFEFLI